MAKTEQTGVVQSQAPGDAAASLSGVSVVICCYNSAARLPRTLQYLARQRVPSGISWEVVLVDNGSQDGTAEVAQNLWPKSGPAPLRIVSEPRPGLSHARTKGFLEARYELVSLVDDDNWVCEDWIESVAQIMGAHPEQAAVGSINVAASDGSRPEWFDQFGCYFAVHDQKRQGDKRLLSGAGLTLRKSAWERLREAGFVSHIVDRQGKSLSSGGDCELCFALYLSGWELDFDQRLRLEHYMPAQRLNWKYLRRLAREAASSTVALDAYTSVGHGRADSVQDWWAWHCLSGVRMLLRRPGALMAAFCSPAEGNADVIEVESLIGRIQGLWRLKSRYGQIRKQVRSASWLERRAF
jgi:glycosyltransferase involved in cell wall biosynthesis